MYDILTCMAGTTILTQELAFRIRKLVLEGLEYKQIMEILNIPDGTWDGWVYRNQKYVESSQGFRVELTNWKNEFFIKSAERVSREIMALSPTKTVVRGKDVMVKVDNDLLRTKQKEAEFLRKTLAKNEGYASRTELTGLDGKDLIAPSIIFEDYDKHQEIETES